MFLPYLPNQLFTSFRKAQQKEQGWHMTLLKLCFLFRLERVCKSRCLTIVPSLHNYLIKRPLCGFQLYLLAGHTGHREHHYLRSNRKYGYFSHLKKQQILLPTPINKLGSNFSWTFIFPSIAWLKSDVWMENSHFVFWLPSILQDVNSRVMHTQYLHSNTNVDGKA